MRYYTLLSLFLFITFTCEDSSPIPKSFGSIKILVEIQASPSSSGGEVATDEPISSSAGTTGDGSGICSKLGSALSFLIFFK